MRGGIGVVRKDNGVFELTNYAIFWVFVRKNDPVPAVDNDDVGGTHACGTNGSVASEPRIDFVFSGCFSHQFSNLVCMSILTRHVCLKNNFYI